MPTVIQRGATMSPGMKREPRNSANVEPESLGAQIRRLRKEKGMSQGELGAAIGTDQARISAYELGRFRPHDKIIIALADALEVPASQLYEASRYNGVLVLEPDLRERLQTMPSTELEMLSQFLDTVGEITPEQRETFEQGFNKFLEGWREFNKD